MRIITDSCKMLWGLQGNFAGKIQKKKKIDLIYSGAHWTIVIKEGREEGRKGGRRKQRRFGLTWNTQAYMCTHTQPCTHDFEGFE